MIPSFGFPGVGQRVDIKRRNPVKLDADFLPDLHRWAIQLWIPLGLALSDLGLGWLRLLLFPPQVPTLAEHWTFDNPGRECANIVNSFHDRIFPPQPPPQHLRALSQLLTWPLLPLESSRVAILRPTSLPWPPLSAATIAEPCFDP